MYTTPLLASPSILLLFIFSFRVRVVTVKNVFESRSGDRFVDTRRLAVDREGTSRSGVNSTTDLILLFGSLCFLLLRLFLPLLDVC